MCTHILNIVSGSGGFNKTGTSRNLQDLFVNTGYLK